MAGRRPRYKYKKTPPEVQEKRDAEDRKLRLGERMRLRRANRIKSAVTKLEKALEVPSHLQAISERHLQVVDNYFSNGFNKYQAMKDAGYEETTAYHGHGRVFRTPSVVMEIARRRLEMRQRQSINDERVLQEYANIAFSSLGDLMQYDDDGSAYLDFSLMTPNMQAAVSEFTVEEYTEGRGEGAEKVKRIKIKLGDKKGALDALAKHLGLLSDTNVTVVADSALVAALTAGRARVAAQPKQEIDYTPFEEVPAVPKRKPPRESIT